MALTKSETEHLISEISRELGAKRDGGYKNLICQCPFCKKEGKFGIYVGKETERKKLFMSHCFSCGASTYTLEQLLETIGRVDLMVTPVADLSAKLEPALLFPLESEDKIDDSLAIIELPDFYRRTFSDSYLKSRGFVFDDYEYFPAGTTGRLNFRYNDYVIFPVIDQGDTVGYVARHIWSKDEIEKHNRRAKLRGEYRIMRFRNSTENDFTRLLYNYDAVIEDETDTVIIVEGIFDVVALIRKLELYDNKQIAVVATFGKKISLTQIFKLQSKGVETVIIGYDGDAVDSIKKAAGELGRYFEVLIADIEDPAKDWQDLSYTEIYDTLAYRLKTPLEYTMTKIQQ
ncbi:toprim domain-containing protein [Dysgonomonas sp. ZJ709]|uniref:toprim domain-containing protein n=1 Tax=Dysgonomonas sp. ZJ709 TaxID=2709797 RepID=UPI0013ECE51E|nr:toprim domain-containing protein [Dysgonomonas sp. ZJ709]